MKLGFKLPNCAGVICEPEWATPVNIDRLALHAHELGFDSLWFHDHLLTPSELDRIPEPNFYEPLVAMARVATLVPGVTIGVATIVVPLREPVLMAKQLMTLERFFPGRIVFGIGSGRYESEFDRFGSDDWHKRGRVTDEFINLMRATFEPGPTSFAGDFRSLHAATIYPKPTGAPPPIWVGGNSTAALRRTARIGDGWVPGGANLARVREGRDELYALLEAAGRDPATVPIAVSLTIEPIRGDTVGFDDPHKRGLHAHVDRLAGTAPQVIDQLAAFADAGASHFLLSFRATEIPELMDNMAWFSQEVAPALSSTPRLLPRPRRD